MAPNHVTLDDKYDLTKSRIFVTGFQALVRLCARHDLRKDRVAIHAFTDGRDTAPKSGEGWVAELQRKLDEVPYKLGRKKSA